jgi:hypothetical protein
MDIIPDDHGNLRFLDIPDAFFQQLKSLPQACDPAGSVSIEQRLYPSPILDPTSLDDMAAIEDWENYVKPDLEQGNRDAIQTVMDDLEMAQSTTDDEESNWYEFEVPAQHMQDWHHALNVARLVMSGKYRLPLTEFPAKEDEKLSLERLFAAHLCDRYAEIGEVFVHQMMHEFDD